MVFTTAMLVTTAVAQVAPMIWGLIKKAEEIIPEAGMGRIKKQLVMAAVLDDALAIASSLVPGLDLTGVKPLLEEHLGTAIDGAVKIMNSVNYLRRTRLDPKDFKDDRNVLSPLDPKGESGKITVRALFFGTAAIMAAVLCFVFISLFASCFGVKVGTDVIYSGKMTGQGPSALFVQKACYAAQECAGGGEALDQGLPNLRILGATDSNAVECNGAVADSCYDVESRSIILPSNPNEEAVLTACLYDWSFQVNGDPDFAKTGEPWTRGCNRPYRTVE